MGKFMEAIILAGGFGTRLKNVIKDVPKPMAPIQGKPFLEYLLCQLKQFSISNIIMCTGYKHEVVEAYFGTQFKGIPISYSVEREPLGTGGAIMHAFSYINEESFLVLNGDTFFKVDIEYLIKFHIKNNSDCTIALKKITNSDRYGTVKCQNNRIVAFEEKQFREESTINGGLYYIKNQH